MLHSIEQLVSPKFGIKRKLAPRWRTCHAADFSQMWPENDAPHWRNLSFCGPLPDMAKNDAPCWGLCRTAYFNKMWSDNVPLIGGLCLTVDFDQMWSKMCPLSEDFASLQTSTKCGPKCATCWRTLSPADFDQMWSKMCPSLKYFDTLRTSTKCGPNMCPSTKNFVLLQSLTTYGSTTYSSSKRLVPNKQSLSINQRGTETTIFEYVAI